MKTYCRIQGYDLAANNQSENRFLAGGSVITYKVSWNVGLSAGAPECNHAFVSSPVYTLHKTEQQSKNEEWDHVFKSQ
jgi:hypothetical protein